MAETRTVHLVSQEGEQFDVSLEVAKMSELVKTMFDGERFVFAYFLILFFKMIKMMTRSKRSRSLMSRHIY
jgi:hypothetical protein